MKLAREIFKAAEESAKQLQRLMDKGVEGMSREDILRAARKAQAASEDLLQLAGYLYSKLPKTEDTNHVDRT